MPDELIPAGSHDAIPERDYITEMNVVMAACSMATQLSDLRATENSVRKARAIFTAAEKNNFGLLEFLNILKLMIQVLSNYAQMNAFQLEARFAEALAEGEHITRESAEALEIFRDITDIEEDAPGMSLIRQALEYFNTIGPASIAYIKAEQIGFTGRLDEYRTALISASDLFRKVELLEDSDDPTVLQLYSYATNMADRLVNRARYFEYIQREKTNHYINPQGKKVFIIHGHLEEAAISLQLLLKKEFSLDSVILKNEASSGDSVIEKFESFARDCGYAIAIISSDDLVKKDTEKYFQARPNVVFELGWFYGRYGRSRVCLLKEEGTQIPSDLGGIISLEFDKKINEIFLDLRTELKAAGLVS